MISSQALECAIPVPEGLPQTSRSPRTPNASPSQDRLRTWIPRKVLHSCLASVFLLPTSCTLSDPTIDAADQGITRPERESIPESPPLLARRFHFRYAATIPTPPPGTEELQVWTPLPLEDPGVQHVSKLKVMVNGQPDVAEIHREDLYGNTMAWVRIPEPAAATKVEWTAEITRYEDTGQGTLPTTPQFLQPNRLVPVDGSARSQAEKLGLFEEQRAEEDRARQVFLDVLSTMEYDKKTPGYGTGDFERSLTVCKGNCTDFHARFIGTTRAAAIPARFTMGIPLKPTPRGRYNSYHCWAHWLDQGSWKPVDISEADKIADQNPEQAAHYFGHLDPHRIALTIGRDLTLEPPQSSPPLNYFVFPHAEADGTPMELDKSLWTFEYRNL